MIYHLMENQQLLPILKLCNFEIDLYMTWKLSPRFKISSNNQSVLRGSLIKKRAAAEEKSKGMAIELSSAGDIFLTIFSNCQKSTGAGKSADLKTNGAAPQWWKELWTKIKWALASRKDFMNLSTKIKCMLSLENELTGHRYLCCWWIKIWNFYTPINIFDIGPVWKILARNKKQSSTSGPISSTSNLHPC